MERTYVPYTTFTRLFELVPTFYVPQGTGGYDLFAVGSDLFIASRVTDAEADDFEANHKVGSQGAASADDAMVLGYAGRIRSPSVVSQTDGAQKVAIVGREGVEYIRATHDFCDATTWFQHSTRVTDGAMTDSGDGLTFESPHVRWIDLYHGKVHEEVSTREEVDHKYRVVVQVDGTEKTGRKPFAPSGGDYTIDYKTGKVAFFASQAGKVVRASYSYATDNEWVLVSQPDMALELQYAEIQFTQDLVLKGAILMTYWIAGTCVGVSRYDTVLQIIYEAKGNNPIVKPVGGPLRGISNEMQIFPMTYMAVRRIFSDPFKAMRNNGATEVRFSILDHDDQSVECEGEAAVGTFYGVWRSEAECCS